MMSQPWRVGLSLGTRMLLPCHMSHIPEIMWLPRTAESFCRSSCPPRIINHAGSQSVRQPVSKQGCEERGRRWTYLGASLCHIKVFGDDGGFGHHNARAGVLKLGGDVDILALAVALPVNAGADGHLTVRDKHTGHLLLLESCSRSLRNTGQRSEVRGRVGQQMDVFWWANWYDETIYHGIWRKYVELMSMEKYYNRKAIKTLSGPHMDSGP